MATSLKRAMVWMGRMRHSRGFGIQSPSVYRFVRYVVNEHYPYYAYEELAAKWKRQSSLSLKLSRLYLRIANHVQPQIIVDLKPKTKAYSDYFSAGCVKSHYYALQSTEGFSAFSDDAVFDVVRINLGDFHDEVFSLIVPHLASTSLLIIEDIHHDKNFLAWNTMLAKMDHGVTLDLYYCGIIFFDHIRYKRNYVINF